MVTVYGLFLLTEPERIRYVGQTRLPIERRLANHLRFRPSKNTHPVQRWLKKHLGNVGIRPLVEDAVWNKTEIELIRKFKQETKDLLNVSMGGNGGNLGPEVCAKLRETMAVVSKDPAYRKKLSIARKGRSITHSQQTKEKIAKTLTGRKRPQNSDPEYRRKIANGLRGKRKSAEHRKALSIACTGRSNPNKGIPRPPEVREKIRQSLLRRAHG